MELKKGETILTDAALHLPAACLHEGFSKRSGVPPDHFELYYGGKRLEGGEALANWGVGKDATIEVKMRGRGGMGDQEMKQVPEGEPSSPSKYYVEKKLQNAQDARAPWTHSGRSESFAVDKGGNRSPRPRLEEGGGGGKSIGCGGFGSGGEAAAEIKSSVTGESSSVSVATTSLATVGVDKVGVGAGEIPPTQDVVLSKLLSKLLRHMAVELGVAIDADGWVAFSDAFAQINGARLREIECEFVVIDAGKLGNHQYTEAYVRNAVAIDNKQRFVFSADSTRIRAAQGHDMPGVGVRQGEPLTLVTAPEVAVHGSYLKHVHAILEQGLSRMGRHHVHLAKGLPGEKGVISGMRRDTEVFIWVNVHEAIKGGLTFYESANGVILCDGRDGDGIIPPTFLSVDRCAASGSTAASGEQAEAVRAKNESEQAEVVAQAKPKIEANSLASRACVVCCSACCNMPCLVYTPYTGGGGGGR